MASFKIIGGKELSGTINPQGAKNEALQVISAILLTKEKVVIPERKKVVFKPSKKIKQKLYN